MIEEKTGRELQKPLWFEINTKEFEELTRDIYNNQDNKSKLMIWKMQKKKLDGSNYI